MSTSRKQSPSLNADHKSEREVAWHPRIVLFGIALNLFFWIVFIGLVILQRGVFSALAVDFGYFWAAAQAFIAEGAASVYDLQRIEVHAEPLHTYYEQSSEQVMASPVVYPPVFIATFIPFTLPSSPVVGYALWTAVNLALTIYVAVLLADRVGMNRIVMAASLLAFFPIIRSLVVGQPGGFLLFALFKGIEALEEKRNTAAGVWFGLLIIKPNYVALLMLWALVNRNWRLLGTSSGVVALYAASTFVLLGSSGTTGFIEAATSLGVRVDQVVQGTGIDMMPTWRGLIANLSVGVGEQGGLVAVVLLSTMTVGCLWFVLRNCSVSNDVSLPLTLLTILIITILANPHAHIHAMVLLVVPGVLVAAESSHAGSLVRRMYLATLVGMPVVGMMSIIFTGWVTWVALALFGAMLVLLASILVNYYLPMSFTILRPLSEVGEPLS